MQTINGISPQQFSRQYCNKGKLDCSWYHGNWHLLKALNLVSTSAVHEQAISGLLKQALVDMKQPRILLTGSTDETLVQLAHRACLETGRREKLYAVDICATPLAFMQAWAADNGIDLVTYQANILDFEPASQFDIILTHAFMGYFDDTQRPLLMKKWHQLLSPQGKIITIQRVRPADSPTQVSFSPQQSEQFIATALSAAHQADMQSDAELDTIRQAATLFTKNFCNHAIRSKTALESLFKNADLTFQFLEYHSLGNKGGLSGPSVPSNAEFAHIIAGKSQG